YNNQLWAFTHGIQHERKSHKEMFAFFVIVDSNKFIKRGPGTESALPAAFKHENGCIWIATHLVDGFGQVPQHLPRQGVSLGMEKFNGADVVCRMGRYCSVIDHGMLPFWVAGIPRIKVLFPRPENSRLEQLPG